MGIILDQAIKLENMWLTTLTIFQLSNRSISRNAFSLQLVVSLICSRPSAREHPKLHLPAKIQRSQYIQGPLTFLDKNYALMRPKSTIKSFTMSPWRNKFVRHSEYKFSNFFIFCKMTMHPEVSSTASSICEQIRKPLTYDCMPHRTDQFKFTSFSPLSIITSVKDCVRVSHHDSPGQWHCLNI